MNIPRCAQTLRTSRWWYGTHGAGDVSQCWGIFQPCFLWLGCCFPSTALDASSLLTCKLLASAADVRSPFVALGYLRACSVPNCQPLWQRLSLVCLGSVDLPWRFPCHCTSEGASLCSLLGSGQLCVGQLFCPTDCTGRYVTRGDSPKLVSHFGLE